MKIKIGYSTGIEKTYLTNLKTKQIAFQSLADYLLEYVEEINVNELYKAPSDYAIEIVLNKFKDAYKGAKNEKIFDIIGFSVMKVERLSKELSAIDIQINPNTLNAIDEIDFNIYAETPAQIEKYKAVKNVCDAVKILIQYAPNIHKGDLINALRGAIIPDYANNHVQANISFILNKPR